jgi:putative FmdB family regulatory protein
MPVFEFGCKKCEAVETIVRSLNSDEVPSCQRCGEAMVIQWSAPAVVFKGTGWAKKDRKGAE